MKKVKVKTTYLEMFEDIKLQLPSNNSIDIVKHIPSTEEYRKLFIFVGKDWLWSSRLVINDNALEEIITDPDVEIYLFKVNNKIAGYTELDRRFGNDIELAFLGLMPEYIGKGFGKYMLIWAIKKAWEYNPDRLWLHTCTNDHPKAIELYKKFGFRIYKEEMVEEPILDELEYKKIISNFNNI